MNNDFRLSATRTIWVAFFIGLLITNANVVFWGQTPIIENVLMTIIVAIAATGTSVAVWTSGHSSSNENAEDTKLKRGERVKRLIDLMDDDELHELRNRLSVDYTDSSNEYVVLGTDGELHHRKKSG